MADSKESKTGEAVGGTAGGTIGTAIGGPIGGIIGAYLGSKVGGGIGATFEKDNDSTYSTPDGKIWDKATNQQVGQRYPDGSMVLQGQHFASGSGFSRGGWLGPAGGMRAAPEDDASRAIAAGTAPALNTSPGVGSDSTQGKTGAPQAGAGGGMAGAYTMDRSAWDPTASAGYGGAYVSDQTKALQDELARLQASTRTYTTVQTPGGPQRVPIQINNPDLDKQIALISAQLDQSRKDDSGKADTNRLALEADRAAGRTGPTLQTTKLDFSEAEPLERRQLGMGDLQRQQAEALMANRSGAGQDALIARLNRDLEGGAPSLAQVQLEEGRDAAMRNALSIANSARGPTGGLTQLEALRANQATMQDAVRQAAALRAQEYATTREALGGVLNQQRGQGIQEQNIAATELGQGRGQDLQALADKYNNAVQQGQLTDADARARLDAELRQRGMNDDQVRYYTTQYFGQQNRQQEMAIDREKAFQNAAAGQQQTAINQQQANTQAQQVANQQSQAEAARTDKYIGAGLNAASTTGQSLINSGTKSGVNASPGTNTTPASTGYGTGGGYSTGYGGGSSTGYGDYDEIKDPWGSAA